MKIGYEIFLLVANELNVSKVAKEVFVTPQCVSDHIKRLEQEYGTQLFERKPHFHLTQAGMILQQNLRNIQIMETSMNDSIKDMVKGEQGKFTLGISTSRAPIILPTVLKKYYKVYPKVNISFYVEDTPVLEKRLLDGEIDMFIGVNTSYHQGVDITTLASDEIMLIISSKLLRKYFNSKEIKEMQKGVDIKRFANIPFTLSFKTGKVNRVIEEFLDYQNLHLNVVYNISDSETQILLCAAGICASLCPRMLLSTVLRHNLANDESNQVYMLPIRNLNRPLRVDIACNKNVIYPVYARKFIEILKEEVPRIAKEYK